VAEFKPDAQLYARRLAGESYRSLAEAYGTNHTRIKRHCDAVTRELEREETMRKALDRERKRARRRGDRPDPRRAPEHAREQPADGPSVKEQHQQGAGRIGFLNSAYPHGVRRPGRRAEEGDWLAARDELLTARKGPRTFRIDPSLADEYRERGYTVT
jgi:hypothetical protein